MTDHRIVEIAEAGARLTLRSGRLRLQRFAEDREEASFGLGELACLVLGHPEIQLTHPVLAGLAGAGIAVVVTDEKRRPVGWLLPLEQHATQTERFRAQAEAPLPLRKRLWQTIVRAKVANQARLLAELGGDDAGLGALASRVRSGDPENLEAQAARRYWPLLFGDPGFRRRREGEDQNRFLNYGYAVLRAVTARALCGAGLHPSLGLHHHNRYDGFCLADDLMEPFRPLVDRVVARWFAGRRADSALDSEARRALLEPFLTRISYQDEQRSVFDLLARAAAQLASSLEDGRASLKLPEV